MKNLLIALLLSLLTASLASASAENTLNAASTLTSWERDLKQFESRLNAAQQAMWAKLSQADKQIALAENKQRMAERETQQQQVHVNSVKQNAANTEYALKKARDYNAHLMQQRTAQQATQQPQGDTAYGYANTALPTPQVKTETQTSQEWFVSGDGVFRPAEKTTNTYIIQPAPIIMEQAQADLSFDEDGLEVDTRFLLPESIDDPTQLTLFMKSFEYEHDKSLARYNLEGIRLSTQAWMVFAKILRSTVLFGLILGIPMMLIGLHYAGKAWISLAQATKERAEFAIRKEQILTEQLHAADVTEQQKYSSVK